MEFCVELTYSEMTDDARLDKIASQGVTAISAPIDFIESSPPSLLRERAGALSSLGIKVLTAHPRFGLYNSDYSLVNQYAPQRKRYIEQLKGVFGRMSLFGIKAAPLHTGGSCLPSSPAWALDLCAESVRAVLPEAISAGIVITLENTFFTYPQQWDGGYGDSGRPPESSMYIYDDVGKLCSLIDGLTSPYVKGCFDLGHAHYLGDVVEDHRAMGGRIFLYHLHDNNKSRDMHLPPGYGTLDWELFGEIFPADEPDNRSGFVTYIEADPWTPGDYGLMIRETKALLGLDKKKPPRREYRRCIKCGHLILEDGCGEFCGCK